MIIPHSFKDKSVLVLGLGRSGLAAAKSLQAAGAQVWAWDDGVAARQAAEQAGFNCAPLEDVDFSRFDAMVLSPGIPHTFPKPHPLAQKAKDAKVAIIGEVEVLALSQPLASYAGITGTNGKSTTTALLAHLLNDCGATVEVGGNLGVPALELAELGKDQAYVLEMSSYQLELCQSLNCDVAILTNLSPDHLGRHGGMSGYIAAKKRLFTMQGDGRNAIIGIDDPDSLALYQSLKAEGRLNVIGVSVGNEVDNGVFVEEGVLIDNLEGEAEQVTDLSAIATLPGEHNHQNAALAYAAARLLGLERDEIARALHSFAGLAHRQENVATVQNVRFINDSKATNADAASKALASYEDIYWIIGGVAKEGGITELCDKLSPVRAAYLIGEAANSFEQTLAGRIPSQHCGELECATREAFAAASQAGGGIVLLSPACASFDQYKSFEHRGDHFKEIVAKIAAEEGQ